MGFSKQEYQLLLSSHFSHVRLCATPQTAAHQALLSLGFSRQEYWSGCHFLLQCIKVKRESHSVVSDSSQPHGLQPTRLLRPWDFPGKSTGVGCHCLLRQKVKNPPAMQEAQVQFLGWEDPLEKEMATHSSILA